MKISPLTHFVQISFLEEAILKNLVENAAKVKENLLKEVNTSNAPNRPSTDLSLKGKQIGLYFEKPSTRTRVSFEVAINKLGANALILNKNDLQLSRGEPIKDTARTLSKYLDAIVIRTDEHRTIEAFCETSSIPVINGLSDKAHPCQTIADLLTVQEFLTKGTSPLTVSYVGVFNNVAHSLMLGCLKFGINFTLATPHTPEYYKPSEKALQDANEIALNNGLRFTYTHDPFVATAKTDILYTDVWKSMSDTFEINKSHLLPFQLNKELLSHAKNKNLKVMHCLPAHRGEEITDEVFEAHANTLFTQAENRLYAHMAILSYTFKENH